MSSKNKETAPKEEQPIEETPVEEAPEAMVEEVSETDALRAELESAQNDLAAEKDKNLRLRAEYDNFRKRSARERDNIYADVKADTLKKLLPIFDNLERALRQETADEAYKKGVKMTMTQFLEALQALGVSADRGRRSEIRSQRAQRRHAHGRPRKGRGRDRAGVPEGLQNGRSGDPLQYGAGRQLISRLNISSHSL